MQGRLAGALAALPPDIVRTAAAELAQHLTDWRGQKTGTADALILPRSTDEVVRVVRWAGQHDVAIVPQGGNTGLVGGSVPEPSNPRPTIVLSLSRMNRIESVDPAGLTLRAGAGAILSDVQAAAEGQGCRFPLSLGAKGSATIGGLVSTNAGGVQVLRHGTMRALVRGLEAVLPDGSVLDQLSALAKDNTGYDLKQLLIGAEGTLGIITRVVLRLAPAQRARSIAWVGLGSPDAALALLRRIRQGTGEAVESFELISAAAHDLVLQHLPGARSPLREAAPWHALIELEAEAPLLEVLLGDALAAGEIADATLAASIGQGDAFWALREAIPEAEKRDGGAVKNDISVAVADIGAFHERAVAMLAAEFPGSRPFVFGHLGDGNLHWNIRPPLGAEPGWLRAEGEAARHRLHDLLPAFGGSISAEHGIGTLKRAELGRLGNPARLAAMRAIKSALDPADLMNPGKLLP